jgi:hypothetical protein
MQKYLEKRTPDTTVTYVENREIYITSSILFALFPSTVNFITIGYVVHKGETRNTLEVYSRCS